MKTFIRNLLHKLFVWIFSKEIEELNESVSNYNEAATIYNEVFPKMKLIIDHFDVGIDYDHYKSRHSSSWACFSIQGDKMDYVKFVDMRDKDIRELQRLISMFDRDRYKFDAAPHFRGPFIIETEGKKRRY